MHRPLPLSVSAGLLTTLWSALPAQEAEPVKPALPLKAARLAAPAAQGQAPSQEDLVQRRTAKLAKPVFQSAAWLTDFDAAKQQAKEQQKLILTYFTRSYAH